MSVSDNNTNRGAHGDSSFMLGGLPSSSENHPALAVGSVKGFSAYIGSERIQAEAFRIIAAYMHNVYDGTNPDGMSGDEAFIMGIVYSTEKMLDALEPKEGESQF